MFEGLTPVDRMGNFYVKREDLAHWVSLDLPSGSKVRQYLKMANTCTGPPQGDAIYYPPCPPCIVGCSANSCQQIYVAATARTLDTKGIIYVPSRKHRTSATAYCDFMGAEIVYVKPGYLSVVRARAKARAKELRQVVGWNPELAIEDTAQQCSNIPDDVKRIVVASGSGLTAAGILRGLQRNMRQISLIVVATSSQGTHANIEAKAKVPYIHHMVRITPVSPYDAYVCARLPDGTPMDPFYSAKTIKYLQQGDMLWPPGLRPVRSMPEDCQKAFKDWKGPEWTTK